MFKKIGLTVLILGLMVGVGYACTGNDCKTTGNVMTSNDGNKGNIFTYDCNQGQTNVGKWVDPSDVPELKGEKGETGATGATGQNGLNGTNGTDGRDGIDGLNGANGQDGQNGRDGVDGAVGPQGDAGQDGQKGDAGSQGEQGQAGVDGENGKTPIKGVDYNDGANGQDGLNGKDVDPATVEKLEKSIQQNTNTTNNLNTRVNKLEETQNIIGGVLRIKDTKKWSVDLFIDYSTNRQMIDRQGIRFTYKMGESYQDKENKRLEARIKALENK
jgi:hypothetical protein